MTRYEIDQFIQKEVKSLINTGDYSQMFSEYKAEAGWQDWMDSYTVAKDDEPCSESESKEISKIQAENFIACFPEVNLKYYPDSESISEVHWTGRGGYHGGGRKPTGIKRVSINISGQPEQIAKLKEMAKKENKTVSGFIFDKTGII